MKEVTGMTLEIPRIVLAGTHSGVGKTTIATGIMAALTRQGLPIQPYKVGPDYIDPSYHSLATGRPSRNLDRWMLGENLLPAFAKSAAGHWAVIEGVMGLFDGMSGTRGFGSSADVAKLLQAPVVLVVDAANMSRSVAAVVHGFSSFDPELNIAGVILNRVKSPAQESLLRDALAEIEMPILGVLPKDEKIRLPERHLGLVPSQEKSFSEDFWDELNRVILNYIDLDKIREIIRGSIGTETQGTIDFEGTVELLETAESGSQELRLGVALDEGFSFYYEDAFDQLREAGFRIVPFSPLYDTALPEGLDALFLGGGFPEMHLERLSGNRSFMESLRAFAQSGRTIYAECGGYMYLGKAITDFEGKTYPMAGLIPIEAEMTKRLQGMGYRKGVFRRDSFLGVEGSSVHGHEFHYSRVNFCAEEHPESSAAFELIKGGESLRMDGYAQGNIMASYLHLNFAGHPELLERWAELIRQGVSQNDD
jgi:cobyrinic acid a,c-diamide synthase